MKPNWFWPFVVQGGGVWFFELFKRDVVNVFYAPPYARALVARKCQIASQCEIGRREKKLIESNRTIWARKFQMYQFNHAIGSWPINTQDSDSKLNADHENQLSFYTGFTVFELNELKGVALKTSLIAFYSNSWREKHSRILNQRSILNVGGEFHRIRRDVIFGWFWLKW